jgi:hypothetical protein
MGDELICKKVSKISWPRPSEGSASPDELAKRAAKTEVWLDLGMQQIVEVEILEIELACESRLHCWVRERWITLGGVRGRFRAVGVEATAVEDETELAVLLDEKVFVIENCSSGSDDACLDQSCDVGKFVRSVKFQRGGNVTETVGGVNRDHGEVDAGRDGRPDEGRFAQRS